MLQFTTKVCGEQYSKLASLERLLSGLRAMWNAVSPRIELRRLPSRHETFRAGPRELYSYILLKVIRIPPHYYQGSLSYHNSSYFANKR